MRPLEEKPRIAPSPFREKRPFVAEWLHIRDLREKEA